MTGPYQPGTPEWQAERIDTALAPAKPSKSMFDGFDDYMEKAEPGYRARRAAEVAAKAESRAAYTKGLIKRYGSTDAGLRPDARERAVIDALNCFKRTVMYKYANGMLPRTTLAGWSTGDLLKDAPTQIVEAAKAALPLPATILEASEECALWDERERELEALLGAAAGDYSLDQACALRREIVREMLETGLRATCLADVLARQRHYVRMEFDMPEVGQALLADLEHLVAQEVADHIADGAGRDQ